MKNLLLLIIAITFFSASSPEIDDPTPKLFLEMTLREIRESYGVVIPTNLKHINPMFAGTYDMVYKGSKFTSMIESSDIAKTKEAVYDMRCTTQSLLFKATEEPVMKELMESWGFVKLEYIVDNIYFFRNNGKSIYRVKRDSFKSKSGTLVVFDVYTN